MTTERIDSTDGKITVFYSFTPWAWAIEIWHKDHDLICDQMIMVIRLLWRLPVFTSESPMRISSPMWKTI